MGLLAHVEKVGGGHDGRLCGRPVDHCDVP